jgi:hypothetical protein
MRSIQRMVLAMLITGLFVVGAMHGPTNTTAAQVSDNQPHTSLATIACVRSGGQAHAPGCIPPPTRTPKP